MTLSSRALWAGYSNGFQLVLKKTVFEAIFSLLNTFFSFMEACRVDERKADLLKITHSERDLEVQRFRKQRAKLDLL